MVGFDPPPVNRGNANGALRRPFAADRRGTADLAEEADAVLYLLILAVAAALVLAGLWLRERRHRRKPLLLTSIMDEADALERALHECRARLREIPALVATLPPSDQLSARATLVAEPQVQAALRDLLAHRLWLKEHAQTASLDELESARTALRSARAGLGTQLDRLAAVRADLEAARTARMARAVDAQS